MKSQDCIAFVHACYAPADSDGAWHDRLLDAASPLFGTGPGFGLSIIRRDASGQSIVFSGSRGPCSPMIDELGRRVPQIAANACEAFYHPPKPVLSLVRDGLDHVPATERATLMQTLAQHGIQEVLGVCGQPLPDVSFCLMAFADRAADANGRAREVLHRLRLHLETGIRLRIAAAEAIALVTPTGKLVHAENPAPSTRLRAALAAGVARIEHSRAPSRGRDAEQALALWRALVDGRFSLVERVDRDGKRHYAAFENPPYARRFRALSPNEARVLELSLQGLMGKHVAYALGLSEGRVSECLSSAALKSGCRGTAHLLRAAADLVITEASPAGTADLTASERRVLTLVRSGRSNMEIARVRGTTPRTVANQVAAILRKTKASSRRALLTLRVGDAP